MKLLELTKEYQALEHRRQLLLIQMEETIRGNRPKRGRPRKENMAKTQKTTIKSRAKNPAKNTPGGRSAKQRAKRDTANMTNTNTGTDSNTLTA